MELLHLNEQFNNSKCDYMDNHENPDVFLQKLERLMNALTSRLNGSMNKKVSFHLGRQEATKEFVTKKPQVKKKRKWTTNRKKKNRAKYKMKVKETGKNKNIGHKNQRW